jgi:hypothetical protein
VFQEETKICATVRVHLTYWRNSEEVLVTGAVSEEVGGSEIKGQQVPDFINP